MEANNTSRIPAQDLGKTLLYNNSRMTRGEFFQWLTCLISHAAPGFHCGDVAIPEGLGMKHYSVIMSDSAIVPNGDLTSDEMFDAALRLLEYPVVGIAVAENKVSWNDDDHEVVADNENDVLLSVVLNRKDGFTVVYESGPDYIRIVSVTCQADDFIVNSKYFVIEISEHATITCPSLKKKGPSIQEALAELETGGSEI